MEVKKIFLVPFKSLKAIELDEWEVDEHGFLYDRMYMLVHKSENGIWVPMTQRSRPEMARIKQEIKGPNLRLSYGSGRSLELPLDVTTVAPDCPDIHMKLWGYSMVAKDISDEKIKSFFADFFSDSTLPASSLAVLVSGQRRRLPVTQTRTEEYLASRPESTCNFQDLWPGSLMTTASLDDVQSHVDAMTGDQQIDRVSFRMNILVETDEPWIEDDWLRVQIGGHEWFVDSPRERCPVPSVDPELGVFRKGRMPTPALNKYRVLEKGSPPSFGINMINGDWGYKVRVGDKVEVLASY